MERKKLVDREGTEERKRRRRGSGREIARHSEGLAADSPGSGFLSPTIDHEMMLGAARSDEQRATVTRRLQGTYGNRYVQHLLESEETREASRAKEQPMPVPSQSHQIAESKAVRSEDDTADTSGPDWNAPIEADADVRTEVGRSQGVGRAEGGSGSGQGREEGEGITFPSYGTITGDSTVKGKADKAWQDTLDATTKTSRREQGFWIRWNKKTSNFSVTGEVVAPAVDNATTASVDLPAKPADAGDEYTVASFHTHTPTRYRSVGRAVGPSGADKNADNSDNVAGVVHDYTGDGTNIPAKHPLKSPSKLYNSGPYRRA